MEPEQYKTAILEYYQLTKQINELSKRRGELSKQLVPSMEKTGHKQFRLASEGGHMVYMRKTSRPKPFNIKYLKTQIHAFFGSSSEQSEQLITHLLNNRDIVQESRLFVKMAAAAEPKEDAAPAAAEALADEAGSKAGSAKAGSAKASAAVDEVKQESV